MMIRFALTLALLTTSAFAQDRLAVCDSKHKRIMLYDATNGALINKDFIVNMGTTYVLDRPREVLVVGSELWVLDQGAKAIHRFSVSGNWLATITTVDNPRGGVVIGNTVHVTNTGTGNGAPGTAVMQFDTAGNYTSFFATANNTPYDVLPFMGDFLVSDTSNVSDAIERYTTSGAFLGSWSVTTVANLNPQQLQMGQNGNVFCASASGSPGIYEFDSSTGNEVNRWTLSPGGAGLHELPNGDWMYGSNTGVFILNPVTQSVVDVSPSDGAEGRGITAFSTFVPTRFCVAKTQVVCGVSSVDYSGVASATASSGFTVSAGPARGCRSGLLMYSDQPTVPPIPFGGAGDGMLCLFGGIMRAAPIDSGGTPNTCDGVFSIDLNAFRNQTWVASGCSPAAGQTSPAAYLSTPGHTVSAQMWGRDSTTTGQFLSDGLSWTIQP